MPARKTSDLESMEPATERQTAPVFDIGVDSTADPNEPKVLLLYAPDVAQRGEYTEDSLIVPIEVPVNAGNGDLSRTFEYKAVRPGLQRVAKSDAEKIVGAQSRSVQAMVRRNVLRIWSQETDIAKMSASQAIDAIRLAKSRKLLGDWAKAWHELAPEVQRELEARQETLERGNEQGAPKEKFVFGQRVA